MTLLVLEIDVPNVSLDKPDELWHELAGLWPQFFAYGLGFWVIAVNWMAHHRKFQVFTGYDARLIQLNLLLLLLIAFVPYPTALLSSNGSQPAAIILYAATVAAISIVQFALWAYARWAGLLAPSVDKGMYRLVQRSLLDAPAVFGISIVVAAFGQPDAAMYVWILILPLSFATKNWPRAHKDDLEPAVRSRPSSSASYTIAARSAAAAAPTSEAP